jgi:uncharacterized cupin superfamily protein
MSEDTGKASGSAVPISIDRRLLAGEGLSAGDLSEFDDEGITADDATADFHTHNFHTGNIMVSVYEAGPGKVRIDGSVYDEFITILEGRLILTPDVGGEYEYQVGDSLVVPKGYQGGWEMPERYRELIVVDTEFMREDPEAGDS